MCCLLNMEPSVAFWPLAPPQYPEQTGLYIQIHSPGFCCLCFRYVFTPPHCAAICLDTTNPTLPAGLCQSVAPCFCFSVACLSNGGAWDLKFLTLVAHAQSFVCLSPSLI